MSAVFRHADHAIEVSGAPDLATQAAAILHWLKAPANAERVRGWTLDLDIVGRDPSDVLATEKLPFELVERLIALRVRLRLSIRPS